MARERDLAPASLFCRYLDKCASRRASATIIYLFEYKLRILPSLFSLSPHQAARALASRKHRR